MPGRRALRDRPPDGGHEHCGPGPDPAPARAEARMAEGPRPRVAQLRAAEGADARAGPAHGLRRGALPQHRRVLAPRHRHVHDPRRRLHPRLRVLRRAARQAGRTRPRRAGPGGRGGAQHGPPLRGDHVGRPGRPRGRRGVHLRRDHPARPGGQPFLPHRGADPGLPGPRGPAPGRARRGPGRAEPQHRDGAAAVQDGAAGRPLPPDAGAAAPRPAPMPRLRHEVGHHGRPRRRVARGHRDAGRSPGGWRWHHHHRAVPEPVGVAPARGALLPPGRVRDAARHGGQHGVRPRRVRPPGEKLLPCPRADQRV